MATKDIKQTQKEDQAQDHLKEAPQEDDGREDIFVPMGQANEDPNLFVGINGVNYILPRGQTSRVPKFVAEEIRRCWAAAARQAKNQAAMQQ